MKQQKKGGHNENCVVTVVKDDILFTYDEVILGIFMYVDINLLIFLPFCGYILH